MKSMTFQGALTRKKELVFHLIFWVLLIYFNLFSFDPNNPYLFSIKRPGLFSVSWAVVFIATFYFNYLLIMPKVFSNFNWKKALLGFLAGFLFFVSSRFLVEEVLFEILFHQSNYFEGTSSLYYLYDNLFFCTLPLIPSTVFWLIVYLFRVLDHNKHIIEEKRKTEVKFLKAQLNPHFMFNTLNNIYSLVYFKSEKALPAIDKFSSLMRFTTYELQKEEIKLQDEINYIRSYIELEELRQENHSNAIEITINIENPDYKIPPFLLVPLIENALKHGSATKEDPTKICLTQQEKSLILKVSNRIGNHKKDQVGGIGLENLKKRLEISFPNNHQLELKEVEGKFIAQLEIQFYGRSH